MQKIPSAVTTETAPDVADEPLGAGATALSSVFGLLVGIVVGVITTFTHGVLLPWGLLAGLAIVAALVGGFRLVFGSRVVGGAAAVGVIGASAVLAMPGAGGTALALDGWPGYVWTFGPAAIAVIMLLLPRSRRRASA
jgi:N-acetyl-1-D-myo-inositol-2-amino-2-deoxy-alpha-D-glucopyranoside deacetylase